MSIFQTVDLRIMAIVFGIVIQLCGSVRLSPSRVVYSCFRLQDGPGGRMRRGPGGKD